MEFNQKPQQLRKPSSATLLVLCIIPTSILQFNRLIQNKLTRAVMNCVSAIFGAFSVVGRLLSGVHWFTDILGGVLLSAALLMLYDSAAKSLVGESPAEAGETDGPSPLYRP